MAHGRELHTDKEKMVRFILAFTSTGRFDIARRAAKISRRRLYRFRSLSEQDPKNPDFQIVLDEGEEPIAFHIAWKEAVYESCDNMEDALSELGIGYDEPVIWQGGMCYLLDPEPNPITGEREPKVDMDGEPIPLTMRKRSETALYRMLKVRRPKEWGDKDQNLNVNLRGGVLVVPVPARNAEEYFERMGEHAEPQTPEALAFGVDK